MTESGTCGTGLVYQDWKKPDLTLQPYQPRREPKQSSAPESWGDRGQQHAAGNRPIIGASGMSRSNRHKRGGRAAFQ